MEDAHYDVAEVHRSGTVDLIAKSNEDENQAAILTKCLSQLDNFKTQHSNQMIALSRFIGAIPLLIANCYKSNQELRDETLYNRHTINAINLNTFKKLLDNNVAPHKIAMRGSSVNIKISGTKLKNVLNSLEDKKTLTEISRELDISRQTLSNYQTGQSLPSEETFQRIIAFFTELSSDITKDDFLEPLNILDPQNVLNTEILNDKIEELHLKGFRSEVHEKLNELHFSSMWFQKLPWDGVSREKDIQANKLLFFTGLGEKEHFEKLLSRIDSTEHVVKLFNNKSIWIIQDEKIIPELQDSLKTKSSNIKIYSFNNIPDIKKEKN